MPRGINKGVADLPVRHSNSTLVIVCGQSAFPINPISFELELEFYTTQDETLLAHTGLNEAADLRTKLCTDE